MVAIAIIDYDIGNLHSVRKALEQVGAEPIITADPQLITAADGVILPGVGAFDHCLEKLRDHDLEAPIKMAIAAGKPFLGICVGMQILFEGSTEGQAQGLGIFAGKVLRFRPEPNLKIPHMGWNQLQIRQPTCLLWQNLPLQPWMYFVHSYFAIPADPSIIAATTQHGSQTATVAIAHQNLMAVQFHPEKSSTYGITVLANFVNFVQQS